MEKYSKTIHPNIKGDWNADETLILTKRGKDKKMPNKNFKSSSNTASTAKN